MLLLSAIVFVFSSYQSFAHPGHGNSLEGSWLSNCKEFVKTPMLEEIFGESYRIEATFFNGESMDYKKQVYSDERCENLTHEIVWGAEYSAETETRHIDFKLNSVTIVPRSAAVLDVFACFPGEWTLNVPLQVAGVDCDADPNNGGYGRQDQLFENVYSFSRHRLLLSFDRPGIPGVSPRPERPDPRDVFHRRRP